MEHKTVGRAADKIMDVIVKLAINGATICSPGQYKL